LPLSELGEWLTEKQFFCEDLVTEDCTWRAVAEGRRRGTKRICHLSRKILGLKSEDAAT